MIKRWMNVVKDGMNVVKDGVNVVKNEVNVVNNGMNVVKNEVNVVKKLEDRNFEYENTDKSFSISISKRYGNFSMTHNHFHDNYELYYLLKGGRRYFIKDRLYEVKQGDLVFINRYELHKTLDSGAYENERILINFKDSFLESYSSSLMHLLIPIFLGIHIIHIKSSRQHEIEKILMQLLSEAKQKNTGFEASLHSVLLQLLIYIARYFEQEDIHSTESINPMHRKVYDIVRYLNSSYMQQITLDYVSKKFFVSKYHLSRIFKDGTGFTFTEYLKSIRIKEAQRLLRQEHKKVIDIASEVGFDNIAHFGRTFKQVVGMSPLAYRKSSSIKL